MQCRELVAYLDEYLALAEVPDFPNAYNGLQVEGRPEVQTVAVAVDACQATIDQAIQSQADMLLVHHGLFWGERAPVTGAYYRRLSALIKNDLSLYSCHLPLDVHPEVGNNHVLARQLGLMVSGLFAQREGVPLGVWADTQMPLSELARRVEEALHVAPQVIPTGPAVVRKIGIITGGAGSHIGDAVRIGCDTFLTGEGAHHTYFEAEEQGVNLIYAGHYATETVGVQALAEHLQRQLGLQTLFLHHPTGL
jgi:dinuclear metal center YbgI/SA1388 family protein